MTRKIQNIQIQATKDPNGENDDNEGFAMVNTIDWTIWSLDIQLKGNESTKMWKLLSATGVDGQSSTDRSNSTGSIRY